ncbi:peptidase S8 [Parashewanella curva]|uniref:Peptidase S8 n=1 Tax=Parashewanella curva TaxID=2338552 RepID=A0A3L8Q066_9GAMM|nr:S8 family serine peptidase [Parashewanella curva]RLV60955.1 peptidase S8 [Parashewanella curva]
MKNISKKPLVTGLSTLAMLISTNIFANGEFSKEVEQWQKSPLPKRYIVKFNTSNTLSNDQQDDSFNESFLTAAERFSHKRVMNSVQANDMRQIGQTRSYTAKLNAAAIRELESNPNVAFVEEDVPRRLLSEFTPWGQAAVGATQLSDGETGNRTICIIDSGYDNDHEDLSGNNVEGTNDSGTGNWFDPGANNAHGTHVAGTIAAINNDTGVVGVMPNQNVNIHVIKVFNSGGWGYSSDLVSAVNTCVSNNANIVTMSLGGPSASTTERNALASISNNGVLLIAAAGNAGNNTHSYPASYDSVMSVAAVDSNKQHAAFSQFTNQVEISGPGEAILSTVTMGEGRLADITIGTESYYENGVVPHNRLIRSGTGHAASGINGSVTGELAECSVSGTSFNCGSMTNKVCLVERVGNQSSGNYPDINAVKACEDAGAAATIVYSNTALPGLQNPFLLDSDAVLNNVSVSVDRATGLTLKGKTGQTVTVKNTNNENYAYYNGTSMATPHVSGVAALVWSYHPQCTAEQIRNALKATAEDLDVSGRDDKTGFGLVNAAAAKAYLDNSCTGTTPPTGGNELENGVAKTNLSGASNEELRYTMNVPAGATDLSFAMSGGSGDADLYVRFGNEPTTGTFDCRPYRNGNTETCSISNVQAGTYHVMVRGYTNFSGVSLVGRYTEQSGGTPSTYTNTTDYAIPDNNAGGVESPIAVSRSGDSGTVSVTVDITHTYIGDLQVELHAPNGTVRVLHDNTGGSANDIQQTYSVNMSGVESSGTWKLKVVDSARRDTGTIRGWQLSFQ